MGKHLSQLNMIQQYSGPPIYMWPPSPVSIPLIWPQFTRTNPGVYNVISFTPPGSHPSYPQARLSITQGWPYKSGTIVPTQCQISIFFTQHPIAVPYCKVLKDKKEKSLVPNFLHPPPPRQGKTVHASPF